MTKKEKAIQLLERIPEEKMDYILGVLEGAAIPTPELSIENIASFLTTEAEASEDPDMDELCEALEKMARAELRAYANGTK